MIGFLQISKCENPMSRITKNAMMPRRRKPAFVTHDNEASLCVCHDDPAAIPAAPSLSLRRG